MASVLIVDDEPNIRRMVGALLRTEGYEVDDAGSGLAAVQRVRELLPDAVLLDLMMPGALDGLATLERLHAEAPELPVIMMSGRAGLSDAVRATQLGAFNFLEKPLAPEGVLLALRSALELTRTRRAARALREELGLAGDMVGASEAMARVREAIARVAPSEARVLITGESGTGKELVASAIHEASARRDAPFVRVNCAAIPRDLLESEMFGHERGAFTGATAARVGRFELAHTGTLFLDEIGDLSVEAQAKLLRAIEAKEISRVGGNRTIRADVRVVAATNHDLTRAVADGRFREDLYFRLNVIPVALPPLRERGDDVAELVRHFSELQHQRTGRPTLEWSDGALAAMRAYQWPGNVRELANIVERLAIMSDGSSVSGAAVRAVLQGAAIGSTPLDRSERVERAERVDPSPAAELGLAPALDAYERGVIQQALDVAGGNIAEAARNLRTDRPNLYRRMKRLGIISSALLIVALLPAFARAQQRDTIQRGPPPRDSLLLADTLARDTLAPDTLARDSVLAIPVFSGRRARLNAALASGKTYNRVEGLPVLAGVTYDAVTRPLTVRAGAFAIFRTATGFPSDWSDIGRSARVIANFAGDTRFALGAESYDVVDAVERWQLSEPEAGLAAFLLRRDYRDYYGRRGGRLTGSWQVNQKARLQLGFAQERWSSRDARDPVSVFRNGERWRPNPAVDDIRLHLLTLDGTLDTRNDQREPSAGWWLQGAYERGARPGSSYGRAFFDLRRYNRLSPVSQVNGRIVLGGYTNGDALPLERRLSVSGLGTLPGYDFRSSSGTVDVQQCSAGTILPGQPATCDRVALAQLELRRELRFGLLDVLNSRPLRIRSVGFTVRPVAVLFADAGRGWLVGSREGILRYPRGSIPSLNTFRSDVGAGIDLGLLGVYVARGVSGPRESVNFFLRVRRRF